MVRIPMPFKFGFTDDDIEYDAEEEGVSTDLERLTIESEARALQLHPAKRWSLDEILATLPSTIYYNLLSIPALPYAQPAHGPAIVRDVRIDPGPIVLPRREIFDVRTQLMAEADLSSDDPADENDSLIAGLDKGDLNPRIYEGGFKTWECAIDLARLLAKEVIDGIIESDEGITIVELGTGTAIPSLAILQRLLTQPPSEEKRPPVRMVFADYNTAVLRLVTVPNILLTWVHCRSAKSADAAREERIRAVNEEEEKLKESGGEHAKDDDLELDITPELLKEFCDDLRERGIELSLISGAWSPEFVELVLPLKSRLLVLASETIYSPASLQSFTKTLVSLLKRRHEHSTALIAAKKVYFGVGGGINEFYNMVKDVQAKESCRLKLRVRLETENTGVGRVVLEVAMADDQ